MTRGFAGLHWCNTKHSVKRAGFAAELGLGVFIGGELIPRMPKVFGRDMVYGGGVQIGMNFFSDTGDQILILNGQSGPITHWWRSASVTRRFVLIQIGMDSLGDTP